MHKIETIIVEINSNGVIKTCTDKGVPIVELSGDLTKLHKIKSLILAANRRKWIEETYEDNYATTIESYFTTVGENGNTLSKLKFPIEQIDHLCKYIKES